MYHSSQSEFVKNVAQEFRGRDIAVEVLKEILWSNVLYAQPIKIKKKVIQAMLECFDPDLRMFVFKEGDPLIDIKPLIQKILGVANGSEKVNREEDHEDNVLYQKLTVAGGRSMPVVPGMELLKKVLESVEKDQKLEDKREFCILFILEALGYYLGTKSSRVLGRDYLKFFKGKKSLEDLKKMKWCDLLADLLIDHMVAYKKGDVQLCFGPVPILEVTDVLSSECLLIILLAF